ncbi:protein ripply2-like [Nerophis ophidion]|uniref:protein ripply2-like n=1 Tax=Nerophis ophidion TaxID=159077 RepID=UPI002ADF4B07|nr:protein ripply2-like [Nerophis ophidion]XP_061742180.1 protein ripply2-like [Nerophis ophidion]
MDVGGFNLLAPLGNNDANPQSRLWRPWTGTETRTSAGTQPAKPAMFVHPVKLFWPKTKCFDYLYREAEMLLQNYPVQATICPFNDPSSSEDDTEEEEDDVDEEQMDKLN